jgi:hypothetical protein
MVLYRAKHTGLHIQGYTYAIKLDCLITINLKDTSHYFYKTFQGNKIFPWTMGEADIPKTRNKTHYAICSKN